MSVGFVIVTGVGCGGLDEEGQVRIGRCLSGWRILEMGWCGVSMF